MDNIKEKLFNAPIAIKILFVLFLLLILELTQSLVVILIIFIALYFITIEYLKVSYEADLKNLLLVVKGNITSRSAFGIVHAVLDGFWNDKRIKIGINKPLGRNPERGIFIIFYLPISNFDPMKVRPLKNILGKLNLPIEWHAAKKIKLEEYGLEVLSQTQNEEVIKKVLIPERIQIIKYFFTQGFDIFEINKDENNLIFLKLEIEISLWLEGKREDVNRALDPIQMDKLLQRMNEFTK